MSRNLDLKLEEIANKIKSYEGQLILVQKDKEITENYGEKGKEYFMTPIHTKLIHTVEAGILVKPLLIFDPITENLNELFLEINPLIGEIMVQCKARLETFQYYTAQKSDITFSKDNIHLFLEDFIKKSHEIYGTEFNTNTKSKFYSQINSFNIIYGNDNVKGFLDNKYKDLGNNMLKELMVLSNK